MKLLLCEFDEADVRLTNPQAWLRFGAAIPLPDEVSLMLLLD